MDKWQRRFWEMANLVSTWSKDPNQQVGAVVVSPDKLQFTIGYNGYPRSIPDESNDLGIDKNNLTVHAEVNAVLNSPTNVRGWSLYTTKPPCLSCALIIIQAGIHEVFVPALNPDSKWFDQQEDAIACLRRAGVRVVF